MRWRGLEQLDGTVTEHIRAADENLSFRRATPLRRFRDSRAVYANVLDHILPTCLSVMQMTQGREPVGCNTEN